MFVEMSKALQGDCEYGLLRKLGTLASYQYLCFIGKINLGQV